jgi:RND family efflux transporter MFP subunit
MMRRALLPIGLLAVVSLIVPLPVWAQEVHRPVVSEILAPQSGLKPSWVGTVTARVETDLGFSRAGTLAERPVNLGDVVVKDRVLALQDPQDLDAELRAAEAGVTVAAAQANSARDAADRVRALVERGVDSEAALQRAAAQLAAAEAFLEQAQATKFGAEDARQNATLRAPQDGVVTQVFAEPGATLAAGAPVLRLAGTEAREVVIDVTEGDVAGIAPGAVFRVRLEANLALEAKTHLTSIDPVATRATRTRQLRLALAADAPQGFRLGALVQVEPFDETAVSMSIPATAVIEGSDPAQVWRVSPSDRAVSRITIEIGQRAGDRILVLAGLSMGDEIVIKGVNSIKDGQIVGPRVQK